MVDSIILSQTYVITLSVLLPFFPLCISSFEVSQTYVATHNPEYHGQ